MLQSTITINRQKSNRVKFCNLKPGSYYSHSSGGSIYLKLEKTVTLDGTYRMAVSLVDGKLCSTGEHSEVICLDIDIQTRPHAGEQC